MCHRIRISIGILVSAFAIVVGVSDTAVAQSLRVADGPPSDARANRTLRFDPSHALSQQPAKGPDSILNGLAYGAGFGALAAYLVVAAYDGAEGGGSPGGIPVKGSMYMKYTALGAGIGGGIGALIDALRGRKQVGGSSSALYVAPVVLRRKVALGGTVRW